MATSLTLKCKHGDDLRRRTLSVVDDFGIDELRKVASELFQLNHEFTLLWRDEDEDLVTIDSNQDVAEAIRCSLLDAKPILRLELRINAPTPSNHANTTASTPRQEAAFVELAKQLPAQLMAQLEPLAREFEKHAPAFQEHAQKMARQFQVHASELHKHMPAEFTHKAHGLCKFLKKAKKGKKLHMKFVADTSLPDGTELLPGVVITKSWNVVNSGQDTWPANTRLQHVGSDIFDGVEPSAVPCLEPGQETELALANMTTPSEPGRYMSHWRLSTPEGKKFGDRLWFDVTVLNSDGSEATPVVHLNVVCDVTGMSPIVGNRFKKFGYDYDLCQEAFDRLSDEEKQEYRLIVTPEDAAQVHADEAQAAERAELLAAQQQLEAAAADADADAANVEVHEGFWCDICQVHPIRGTRYWKQNHADTFDVCEGCYGGMGAEQRAELTRKDTSTPVRHPEEAPTEPPAPVKTPATETPAVNVAPEDEEDNVFDTSDLTASCMADIEATFEQLSNEEQRLAEEEAARLIAVAEAKAEAEAREAAAKALMIAEAEAEQALLAEAEEALIAQAQAEKARLAEAEAEKARIAEAEAEKARLAEEAHAQAETPATEFPVEWRGVADALVNMGFSTAVAETVTMNAQGDFDTAIEAALSFVPPPPTAPPAQDWDETWDYLLEELVEMGFEDQETNKKAVAAHKGDLKSTVTALVTEERAKR